MNAGAANQPQLDPQFSPEIARRDAALEDSGARVPEGDRQRLVGEEE